MSLPNAFRTDLWIKTVQGLAVTGAHVYVLSQPTVSVPQTEQLGPPSPLATLFTDSTGNTTLSQPLQTDAFGHCDIYAAPNIYTVLVYNNGTLQQVYADQSIGTAGLAPITNYTAGTGISIVGSVISGAYVAGSGITIVNGVISNVGGSTLGNNQTFGRFVTMYGAQGNAANTYGANANASNALGTLTAVNSGATDDQGSKLAAVASASTNTLIGCEQGSTGGKNAYGMQSWYRWSCRFIPGVTTNVRFLLGLTSQNGNFLPGSALATDTPGQGGNSFVGFRYSAGVDTVWVAIVGNGTTQTVVSTGISLDTVNSHLFEITWDGTNYNFWYDNVQVAAISTNTPSASAGASIFWTGDNKNSNNAISGTFFWMTLRLK